MASIINATILNAPEKDPIEELFTVQLPLLFTITPFSIWKAAVCKWLNLVLTFAWSYMDLFIMIISVGLASQFRQLNESLARVKKEVNSDYCFKCFFFKFEFFSIGNY